jgi:3-hydroxyisobutyrate dehydrogenase-like beta-hydroxyacid dehydrogenase
MTTIGFLHPGDMGSVMAGAARAGGARTLWASAGRSPASRERAARHGLEDAGSLAALLRQSDVVACVCPPDAALDVARQVAAHGFGGTYLDANAVAPATARAIGEIVEKAGARFVDGGIVGPPPARPGTTRLYLSGPEAGPVGALFAGTTLEAIALDGPPGAASALKMAYAAWTKGSAALLLAVTRRTFRSTDAPPLAPIATLHYVRPLIDELLAEPPQPGYLTYLRYKLATVAPQLVADADHQLP